MPLLTDYDAQDRIDKEIDFHRAAIQELSSRRNKLSAINQLPFDVLAHIFLIYKEGFHSFEDINDRFAGSNIEGGWTNVLSICTYWRNIILDTPHFWTSVALSPAVLVTDPDLPSRSKSLPLSVYFYIFKRPDVVTLDEWQRDAVEEFISENFSRFQRLIVDFEYATRREIKDLLSMIPQDSTPSLRFFKLCLNPEEDYRYSSSGPGILVLRPSNLGFMTSLCNLELVNVIVPLSFPQLPCLKTLLIEGGRDQPLPNDWVVGFLRHTPNIESVTLREIKSAISGQSPSTHLHLPALCVLHISSYDPVSTHLLNVLEFPLKRVKVTHSIGGSFNDHHTNELGAFCTAFVSAQQHPTTFKLFLNHIGRSLALSPLNSDNSSAALTLGFPWKFQADLSQLGLPQWFNQVTTLSVQVHDPDVEAMKYFSDSRWGEILLLFANLQSLDFAHSNLHIISYFLPMKTDRLKTLSFTALHMAGCSPPKVDQLIFDLAMILYEWQEAGTGIRKFSIRRCNIPSQYINVLRKYATVDWDGIL
ncbi:hypothetical protein ONZ45_g2739 [Pleurotus djamor]|nr:hypothetical protein ONZ45_g2739 [Pleurotus djamor]